MDKDAHGFKEVTLVGVPGGVRRAPLAEDLLDFLPERAGAFGVDHFVSRAEVVQVLKSAVRAVAKLRQAAVTNARVLADLAVRMGKRLLLRELLPALTAGDLRPRIEFDVAELPGAFHEKVARVDVAVVLDYDVAVTGL